ncbi:MAG: heme ABC exporter ATP-binding protein CcmA [Rhodospirillales bacterium]|nr:heme ABC exporter ATP-binding protein CcmA [Rhodospirillales bacterium]
MELRGEGLACVRGGRPVFHNLTFEVREGGALVLVGPNGAGKSSLLRIIAGLLRPAAGRLLWRGRPLGEQEEPHSSVIHYLGHEDAVKPALTVAELLRFWASYRGATPARIEERIETALAGWGISALADLPAGVLSQGQRRRLALARLLLNEAPIWLLDEPRSALDTESGARLDHLIARHRKAGGIVLVALHGDDHPTDADILDLAVFSGASAC